VVPSLPSVASVKREMPADELRAFRDTFARLATKEDPSKFAYASGPV
jgi:hypothetical protein